MKHLICGLLAALLLLLCACAAAGPTEETTSPTPTDAPTESTAAPSTEPEETLQWPTYAVTADEVVLNIPMQGEARLELFDARGSLLLFAVQEKHSSDDGFFTYYTTQAVGIYDTAASAVARQWKPAEAGWYYCGALTGTDTAVVARIDDYTNAVPSDYSVVSLREERQETVQSFSGAIQVVQQFEDAALFSYYEADGKFGVRIVTNDAVQDVLTWQSEAETVTPLAGDLSVCGERFAYACVEAGQCVLLTADLTGELSRVTLEYQKEKFDNLCLTPNGLLVSLSLDEGTADARRELALFDTKGNRLAVKASDPFYRMAFPNLLGSAVDAAYRPYLIAAAADRVLFRSFSELPEEMKALNGNPVFLLRGDDHTLYFYYTELQRLFTVTLGPAA